MKPVYIYTLLENGTPTTWSYQVNWPDCKTVVCYTAVLSVVTQRSSTLALRDDS